MSSTLRAAVRTSARAVRRPYHTTPRVLLPYKDSQDRESLRPRTAEHTKSGRDDDVAAQDDAAYNPRKTRPEETGKQAKGSPLEASGANQELSKPRGDERSQKDRGAGTEVRKGGKSGSGSPPKNSQPGA